MNWYFIIIVGILAISLMVYFIIRNQKDEKVFEKELDNDYPKSKHDHGDID